MERPTIVTEKPKYLQHIYDNDSSPFNPIKEISLSVNTHALPRPVITSAQPNQITPEEDWSDDRQVVTDPNRMVIKRY